MHPDISSPMVILFPFIIYLHHLLYFQYTLIIPCILHQRHTIPRVNIRKVSPLKETRFWPYCLSCLKNSWRNCKCKFDDWDAAVTDPLTLKSQFECAMGISYGLTWSPWINVDLKHMVQDRTDLWASTLITPTAKNIFHNPLPSTIRGGGGGGHLHNCLLSIWFLLAIFIFSSHWVFFLCLSRFLWVIVQLSRSVF